MADMVGMYFTMVKYRVEKVIDEAGLTPREKQIIGYRFGLVDGIVRSRGEVAKMGRVTPECIRQLETRAMKKVFACSFDFDDMEYLCYAGLIQFARVLQMEKN